MPADYPYATAIDYLTRHDIIRGYENRSFRPELAVTRAEFTKLLVGMVFPQQVIDICLDTADRQDQVIPAMEFPDVPYESWFGPHVCTAWRQGIIDGYPDGTFRPEEGVNFAEAAKMISLAFGLTGVDLPNFGAQGNIEWYKPYAQFLASANAIPPTIKGFNYPLLRGEMAEILYRLRDYPTTLQPVNLFSQTVEDLEAPVQWQTYKSPFGFSIDLPNVWPAPRPIPAGTFDARIPYMRSKWTVYLGPADRQCSGLADCVESQFWIDGYDRTMADPILQSVNNDQLSISMADQTMINGTPGLVIEEAVGNCMDKRAFLFGKNYVYVLNALCGVNDPKIGHMFDELMQKFKEITVPSLSNIKKLY